MQQQEPKRNRPIVEEGSLPQWDDELTEGALGTLAAGQPAQLDIQELLLSIPDRGDLERLFEKQVTIAQIVQLLGRNVSRRDIDQLLEADDVQAAIRRLLSAGGS